MAVENIPDEFAVFRTKVTPLLRPLEQGFSLTIPWGALPAQQSLTINSVQIRLNDGQQVKVLEVNLRPAFYFPQEAQEIQTVYAWGLPLGDRGVFSVGPNPTLLVEK